LRLFFFDGNLDYFVARVLRVLGGVTRCNLLQDIHSLYQLPEDAVTPVEPVLGRIADKELGAVGIGAGISHGQRSGVMSVHGNLIVEDIAGAARAGTGGVAALGHKAGDNAVESRPVIISLPGQEDEVIDRPGDIPGENSSTRVPFTVSMIAVYFLLISICILGGESHFIVLASVVD
jgi:hypothetical protein